MSRKRWMFSEATETIENHLIELRNREISIELNSDNDYTDQILLFSITVGVRT